MDISAYQHMNIRMSTRGKRPLRNLTPSDKVRAIQRIHNGETKASVSRDIGVPESTLRGWCKNEQKLRFMCRQLGSAADQLPMAVVLDNPPEKRSKYDTGHHHHPKYAAASYEDFAYNRLALSTGVDFINANNNNTSSNNNNNSGNAILEKIALNEFMKKSSGSLQSDGGSAKQFAGASSGAHLSAASAMMPLMSADYNQQLSMMQNLSLLSLLNPNLAAMSASAAGCSATNENHNKSPKVPLRATNTFITDAASDSGKVGGILSVKNWAKDPTENSNSNGKLNDTNNNDVKQKPSAALPLLPALPLGDAANFFSLFPPGEFPQLPPQPSADAEGNNTSLLEWYKLFNVSLNFFALATAAAALQTPQATGPDAASAPGTTSGGDENASSRAESDTHSVDNNILYKQLTKMAAARSFNSPTTTSDMSNDSYFDSEPEDLSVRSTTSKLSSAPNSRSQSPAKSIASASVASSSSAQHSDVEQ